MSKVPLTARIEADQARKLRELRRALKANKSEVVRRSIDRLHGEVFAAAVVKPAEADRAPA